MGSQKFNSKVTTEIELNANTFKETKHIAHY